jgi:hypothetical protein
VYQIIRKIHLFAALIVFLFLQLYAVSGYVLEFPSAWPLGPGPATTRRVAFQLPAGFDSTVLAERVKQAGNLHGQLKSAQYNPRTGQRNWMFMGPQAVYQATWRKNSDHLTITVQPFGFYAMLNRFHHLKGFDGGPIYVVWGIIFDLVCLAMLLFAFSGVYLWYKLTKRRTLGWILLGSSITYTAATAIYCVCLR